MTTQAENYSTLRCCYNYFHALERDMASASCDAISSFAAKVFPSVTSPTDLYFLKMT